MAKIKFGAQIVDIRNSVGGTVFSRCKQGAYVRNSVVPTNKQSAAKSTSQAVFGSLSTRWRALTAAQRLAWLNAVGMYQTVDGFGNVITPSGFNLYLRLNYWLLLFQQTLLSLPPAPASIGSGVLTNISGSVGTSTFQPVVVPSVPATGNTFVLFATRPYGKGVRSFSGDRYKRISSANGNFFGNVFASYTGAYGTPNIGAIIHWKMSIFSTTSGESGAVSLFSQTVI